MNVAVVQNVEGILQTGTAMSLHAINFKNGGGGGGGRAPPGR